MFAIFVANISCNISLFTKCPKIKTLFGFPLELNTNSQAILKSRRFRMHSKYFIEMLDRALGMVEAKQVEEKMKELGKLHIEFGVKPSYFPMMGEALIYALKQTLGSEWNPLLAQAWEDVYGKLSSQIIAAMNEKREG